MTREEELIEGLKAWVCDHTEGVAEYVRGLANSGFTKQEIIDELLYCGMTNSSEEEKEVQETLDEIFGN